MAEGWISSISLDWAAAAAAITTETCSPAASSLPPTSQTTSPTLTTSPWARTCFLHCTDQLSQSPLHHRRRILWRHRQSVSSAYHPQLGLRRPEHGRGSGAGSHPPAERYHRRPVSL